MAKKNPAAPSQPAAPDQAAAKKPETNPESGGNSETVAAELPEPTNAQKVRFLHGHPAYAYSKGDVAELTPEHVEKLVASGFVELVTDTEPAE